MRSLLDPSQFDLMPVTVAARDPRLCGSYLDFWRARSGDTANAVPDSVTRQPQAFCLTDKAHTVYGQTAFGVVDRDTVEMGSFVHPNWRGRGLGSILLAKAVTLAGTQGYQNIGALIADNNAPSLRRFELLAAAGFARHDPDNGGRGNCNKRYYLIPTCTPIDALCRALLPKATL